MKKGISFIVCLVLCFGFTVNSFAAEPTMEEIVFTGDTISMTLDNVVNLMMITGTAIETAKINKKSDEAIANGYSESYDTVQSTLNYLNSISLASASALGISDSASSLDAKVAKLTRDFTKANLETNYQTELNSIEKNAIQLYYTTLQAQERYNIAADDLLAKQTTLNSVQKRYNLGTASRIDLMTAQNILISAKNGLMESLTTYNSAKMNFNLQMGYPLMQEIVFTRESIVTTEPSIILSQAIASAQQNRNEVKVTDFAFELQKMLFNNAKVTTSKLSSAYKKQEVTFLKAKQQMLQIEDQIAMDIRVKYMGLIQKRQAVVSSESTLALTSEGYRIAQLTYNAGMSTLAKLQESQVQFSQAKLANVSALADYALAVHDFEYAQGVGTTRLAL